MRLPAAFLSLVAVSCTCRPADVSHVSDARLVATPSPLVLPDAWVGAATSAELTVTNQGGATASVDLAVDAPFAAEGSHLELVRGESQVVTVAFTPAAAGHFEGVLRLGSVEVPVSGDARAPPACPATECHTARFDFAAGACAVEALPDDTPCTTPCVTGGCVAGECRGALLACEDHNPCTVDGCGATGCVHPERECPVLDACTASYCDPDAGCASSPLPDGTLCGRETCRTADICLLGQCVARAKPNAGELCTAVDLAADGASTCVLTLAGTVRCWGGGLTNGSQNLVSGPADLPLAGRVATFSLGSSGALACLESGGLQAFDVVAGPVFDAGAPVLEASKNVLGTCWLLSSGAVECSGQYLSGQLFDGGVRSLAGAGRHFCAARDDGGVVCWSSTWTTEVPVDGAARLVRAGERVDCAVLSDGVSCWNRWNPPVRLAPDITDIAVPRDVRSWATFLAIGLSADGGVSSCDDPLDGGGLVCWPRFDAGTLPFVQRAAVGSSHECYLTEAGDVACTGDNFYGQLGDSSPAPPGPQRVSTSAAALVSVGGTSVAMVDRAGGVSRWGIDESTHAPGPTPVAVSTGAVDAVDVLAVPLSPAVGALPGGVCAITARGAAECWRQGVHTVFPAMGFVRFDGVSYDGNGHMVVRAITDGGSACWWQDGDPAPAGCWAAPAQTVGTPLNGLGVVCSLAADAGVSCRGDNRHGQLGTGNTTPTSGDVAVAGLGPVRKLGITDLFACALETSGRIVCWGASGSGVVPPTPVAGLLPYARDLACGDSHCCALVGSNAVSCWGSNRWNQLGREGVWDVPVSVPLPGRVEQLTTAGATTCARFSSGEVWCWGDNHSGQLGLPPLLSSDAPVWVTR